MYQQLLKVLVEGFILFKYLIPQNKEATEKPASVLLNIKLLIPVSNLTLLS